MIHINELHNVSIKNLGNNANFIFRGKFIYEATIFLLQQNVLTLQTTKLL